MNEIYTLKNKEKFETHSNEIHLKHGPTQPNWWIFKKNQRLSKVDILKIFIKKWKWIKTLI